MTKWYLDCVTAAGEAHVFYAAQVRLGPLRLRYAAMLQAAPGRPTCTRSTLAPGPMPELSDDGLNWECPALRLAGSWEAAAQPVRQRILANHEGALDWHCLQPRSRVRLRVGERDLEGDGYAERLEMTLKPWHLPLGELRWGRFHGVDGGFVVWIFLGYSANTLPQDCAHPRPSLVLVFRDGQAQPDAEITEAGLRIGEAELRLGRDQRLRSGHLGGNVLSVLPRLVRRRLPRSIFNLHEEKWAGSSVLSLGGTNLHGTAIHEVVTFPPRP